MVRGRVMSLHRVTGRVLSKPDLFFSRLRLSWAACALAIIWADLVGIGVFLPSESSLEGWLQVCMLARPGSGSEPWQLTGTAPDKTLTCRRI